LFPKKSIVLPESTCEYLVPTLTSQFLQATQKQRSICYTVASYAFHRLAEHGMPDPSAPDDFDLNPHPQQFLLRVWCEDLGEGQLEWRGRIQHLGRGDVRYFRDWPPLLVCLQEMVGDLSDRARGI
jgi:hypothetical protein